MPHKQQALRGQHKEEADAIQKEVR